MAVLDAPEKASFDRDVDKDLLHKTEAFSVIVARFSPTLMENETHRDKNLSPNTVRLIHSILSEAFDAAVRAKKIAASPCALVTPPRSSKKERRYLTSQQALHLLEVARARH